MLPTLSNLVLDFGEVGSWKDKQPFRVQLSPRPFCELIDATSVGNRIYELFLLTRPGDVWDYVSVIPEELPTSVRNKVSRLAVREPFEDECDRKVSEDGRVRFNDFDALFFWTFDDTEPEAEAWLMHRRSELVHSFARQLLSTALDAQKNLLASDDLLLRHVAKRDYLQRSPWSFLERRAAQKESQSVRPNARSYSDAFYVKLDELLRDPDIGSVRYRASGDYHALRMMATEQRRRAIIRNWPADDAFGVSALVSYQIKNEAWDSMIYLYYEGLGKGDLFVNTARMGGVSVKELIEKHKRDCKIILSTQDEGKIRGFTVEQGDGWFLYRKKPPKSRALQGPE